MWHVTFHVFVRTSKILMRLNAPFFWRRNLYKRYCHCKFLHNILYRYIDTQIHTYIHTYIHTHIHTYIHTYILHTYIHACMYPYMHTHMHTISRLIGWWIGKSKSISIYWHLLNLPPFYYRAYLINLVSTWKRRSKHMGGHTKYFFLKSLRTQHSSWIVSIIT